MNTRVLAVIGGLGAVVLFFLLNAMFTVHQTQQALVLQFGNPVRIIQDPGLHFKVPFIQQVDFFEKRVLDFDAPSVELVLGDQKRLVVDAFARYRIIDALRFRQSVGTEAAFRGRLEPIVFSTLRSVLGEAPLFTILSQDRTQLMNRIKGEVNQALVGFGVELVDVRIKRADLPPENSQAVFRRMQTEREREAKELRAQGAEVGQRIRARADRERRVLIAEAQRESEILRGQGDAEAIGIFAESFGQDPKFFDFYRSLQAYRNALGQGSTNFVLSPNSDFFRFFNGGGVEAPAQSGAGGGAQPGAGAGAQPGAGSGANLAAGEAGATAP